MTTPDGLNGNPLGGTIGRRVARLVADASAYTRARSAGTLAREAEQVMARFWRTVDKEAQAGMWPVLRELVNHPATPDEIKPLLQAAAFPRGQWQAFLAQNVAGTALSIGLGDLFNALLGDAVQEIVSRFPNNLIDPATAAAMFARGITWSRDADDEARRSGLTGDRFTAMVELNRQRLSAPEMVASLFRGTMSRPELGRDLALLGFEITEHNRLIELGRTILTPEQLAEMWNRNIVSSGEGRAGAARFGMSAEDFDRLTELGGMPLSPQELGEAFRRGFIDSGRFRRGIVQGPIRNEWFDVVEQLQDRRMSPQDAAQAVLQGKMSLQDGQAVARAAGLNAEDFAVIIESTGSPPGIETLTEAWNRGIINEAEFTVAFLESNLKNRHIDTLKALRFRTLPREQINITYRNGGFTREQALLRYRWAGFSQADSEAMLFTEEQRQLGGERELSVSTVLELYESRTITEGDATAFLSSLGYSDDNIAFLLVIRDIRADRRRLNLAIGRVRSRYVAHKISETEAMTALDSLQVPPSERDDLIDTWAIEREVSIPSLTVSQVQQALRRNLIDPAGALRRIRELGYDQEDAGILVALAAPAPTGG